MKSQKITDLERYDTKTQNVKDDDILVMADVAGQSHSVSIKDFLKEALEDRYPQKVIITCEACGRWGAYQTDCKHCAFPVGSKRKPEERNNE